MKNDWGCDFGMSKEIRKIKTYNFTLDTDDLYDLGSQIEECLADYIVEHSDYDANEIPREMREDMLKYVVRYMCSEDYQWDEEE